MPVRAVCPECRSEYTLADSSVGKKVRCKNCGEPFEVAGGPKQRIPAAPGASGIRERGGAPSRPAPARRPRDDEEDDRPRRRPSREAFHDPGRPAPRPVRPQDDDEDDDLPRRRGSEEVDDEEDAPRKSKTPLIIGLVVGLLVLVGGGVTLFLVLGKGGGGGGDGKEIVMVDSPEVRQRLAELRAEGLVREEAIFWFSNADPTGQARRKEVAGVLESYALDPPFDLQNNTNLVMAYCRWATEDNTNGLVTVLQREPGHTGRRGLIMQTLGGFRNDQAAEALGKNLDNQNDRRIALPALEAMGPMGEKVLAQHYFHPDSRARQDIQQALERLGTKRETFIDTGLRILADNDFRTMGSALEWFKNYPDPPADRRAEVSRKLLAFYSDQRFRNQEEAGRALMTWADEKILPELARTAKEKGGKGMLDLLTKFKDDDLAVDAIAARLENFFDRGNAARALQTIGPKAEKVVVTYFNHKDNGTREEVRKLLRIWATDEKKILAQVVQDLNSPEPGVKQAAVEYLANAPVKEEFRAAAGKALGTLIYENDFRLRGHVFKAIPIWGSTETVAGLIKLINDPNPSTPNRREAFEALGKTRDPKVAGIIMNRLQTMSGFERGSARKAVEDMGAIAEKAVIPYLNSTDANTRRDAAEILAVIGTRESLPALQQALIRYQADFFFRSTAQRALKAVASR